MSAPRPEMGRAGGEDPRGASGPVPDPGEDWAVLDRAYAEYLDGNPDPPGGSLLAQTILTGRQRRALLPHLEAARGVDLIDAGTGFAPLLLELAHRDEVRAIGVDGDGRVLAAAASIAGRLSDWLHPRSSARFVQGDLLSLPFADASFDVATVRLVVQHLAEPQRFVGELLRVLRPGASAFVVDVDDGLGLTYPPPSPERAALEEAFDACQAAAGGDRLVGRKLSTYFSSGGFEVAGIELLAEARHVVTAPADASRLLVTSRLAAAREEIVRRGLLAEEEFDRCLAAVANEPASARFRVEGLILLTARRP